MDNVYLISGTPDCDGNDVPDECEPFLDCNSNGTHDPCDVSGGLSPDCNTNGLPDECEIDLNELRRFLRSHLASYKTPKHIHLVEALSHTPTGKPIRKPNEGAP